MLRYKYILRHARILRHTCILRHKFYSATLTSPQLRQWCLRRIRLKLLRQPAHWDTLPSGTHAGPESAPSPVAPQTALVVEPGDFVEPRVGSAITRVSSSAASSESCSRLDIRNTLFNTQRRSPAQFVCN